LNISSYIKEGGPRDISENEGSKPHRLFRDGAEIDKSRHAYLKLPDRMKVEIFEMALLESNMDHLQVDREKLVPEAANSVRND